MAVFERTQPDPRLAQILAPLPQNVFNDTLYQSSELAHQYCIHLLIQLLHELRIAPVLANWHSSSGLQEKLEFQSGFLRPLAWILHNLTAAGLLQCREIRGDRYFHLQAPLPVPEVAELRRIGLEIDAANAATLDLLDAAGRVYEQLARSSINAEQALFGMGQLRLWLNYFNNNNPLYAVNNWIGANAAADKLQALAKFRILELGAGAGSASEALLSTLADRDLLNRLQCYVITEPNAFLRRYCQRRLQQQYQPLQNKLRFSALDLNERWEPEFRASFDLVYCINTLHVARDLDFSLAQIRHCLDNGWLIAGECLRPKPGQPVYIEMIFQLLTSFVDVITDSLRATPGFLTASQWHALFVRAGFEKIEVLPDHKRIVAIYPRFATGAVCGFSSGTY